MRTPAIVVVVVCSAAQLGACANKMETRTTTWDDSTTTADGKPAPPVEEKRAKAMTAKEAVAAQQDGRQCEILARKNYERDAGAGLALLRECVHRRDFFDLRTLVTGPWAKDMRGNEELQILAAETVARRGGYVENDTKICQNAKIPIYTLSSVLEQPQRFAGRLVLVRGQIIDVTKEKWGTGSSLVGTIAESTWGDEGPTGLVEETGRRAFVRVEAKDPRYRKGNDLVVAMRFEGTRTYIDEESGEATTGIGVAVAIFDAAPKLVDQ